MIPFRQNKKVAIDLKKKKVIKKETAEIQSWDQTPALPGNLGSVWI